MTTNKQALRRMIIRILIDREISGWDAYKELLTKGIRLRSNYLYMILSEMRNEGLLRARWIENEKGPRKHLYSLSEKGQEEFGRQVSESLNMIMAAFIHANLNARNAPEHVNAFHSALAGFGIPPPGEGDRFVYTSPSSDPLVCYPIGLRILSEVCPSSSIFVVKPPGVRFYDDRPNVTYLDGRRHDMPLKNDFADYLMLEGFPRAASEAETLLECARVLNDRGHLLVSVPSVMLEESKPRFGNFAEFALKQYYDISGQDRVVSIARVRGLLAASFGKLMELEYRGNFVLYAGEKKRIQESGIIQEPPLHKKRPAS